MYWFHQPYSLYRLRVKVYAPAASSVLALLLLLIPSNSPGEETSSFLTIKSWLAQRIIPEDLTLKEVQAYTESRVPTLPSFATVIEWEKYARELRHSTLEKIVRRGEAAKWSRLGTKVEWMSVIHGGEGYHIRKLRYQAVPGMWIPALLYIPDNISHKVPAVLNVNGHDSLGKAAAYKQLRSINLVKRGLVVLNTDWIGMGQLKEEGFVHYRMNQLDLCGTSGLAPFYLAMSRGLDILLDLPMVDESRLAVTGLSGGGWQTIFISSLDERVTLANPVAGYSSFKTRSRYVEDLGDSEQTPDSLATLVDYTHLTALMAPRPTLLTFNATDNCCFSSDHALPPLVNAALPVFELYGQSNRLRTHVNYFPGTHNYDEDNRRVFYRQLKEFFFRGTPGFPLRELADKKEVKSPVELAVPLPLNNKTFHDLASELAASLPQKKELPTSSLQTKKWQETQRSRLSQLLNYKSLTATAKLLSRSNHLQLSASFWRLNISNTWTIPVIVFSRGDSDSTRLVIHDHGRTESASAIDQLLNKGHRVVVIDLMYFGEAKISKRDYLYALLIAAVGERPLAIQAAQLNSVIDWVHLTYKPRTIGIHALGFRSSLIALITAALDKSERVTDLELHQCLTSLKEVINNNWAVNQFPELFCFGLLEHFDIPDLFALTLPCDITVRSPSAGMEDSIHEVKKLCHLLGSRFSLPDPEK